MSSITASRRYRLSKSKIAAFEHCPKRLWLQIHRRHVGRFDADTLTRFQFGHDVGARARFVIPNGVMVEDVPGMQAALDRTAELIARGPIQPIFEATFQRDDVLVRVDILEPDTQGGWRAIEVKASSRVRAYQLADLATQVWVMQGCRVAISRAIIRHLAGPISWRRPDIAAVRFQDTDVTTSIRRYVASRAAVAAAARVAILGPEVDRDMGSYCQRPFSCEFQAYCSELRVMPLLARAR
jgi:hypothetical protein